MEMEKEHKSGKDSTAGGFIIGIIMIFCSFPLLWFNERKYVKTAKRLDVAYKDTQDINVN